MCLDCSKHKELIFSYEELVDRTPVRVSLTIDDILYHLPIDRVELDMNKKLIYIPNWLAISRELI